MSGVMRMVHQPVVQQGSNLCVCGSPVDHVVHGLPDDDVGNVEWWRASECRACAVRYDRWPIQNGAVMQR